MTTVGTSELHQWLISIPCVLRLAPGRTAEGTKQHVILDCYFDEGERRWNLMNLEITNFHRALSTYVRSYRDSGFVIDEIIEPTADADSVKSYPELEDEQRVPNFIIFALRKPERS